MNKSEQAQQLYEFALIKMNNLYTDNKTLVLSLAHSLDNLLISCMFNQVKCTAADFTLTFHRYRGNCFVFNDASKKFNTSIKTSFLSGLIYGLSLKFYTGFYQELSEFLSYLDRFGVNVKIENNSFSIDSNNGFELKSGTRTNVAIERTFKHNLPRPYSNCDFLSEWTDDKELFNAIRDSSYQYEQQFCISKYLVVSSIF